MEEDKKTVEENVKTEDKLNPSESEAKKADTKLSEEIQKKVEEMKSGKSTTPKKENVARTNEKEYTIPIRAKLVKVQKYRRSGKAVKIIREFLVRHMKVRDRDLNKIRIDRYLNDFIWARGIKNPPAKIKVKVYEEAGLVRVELAEITDALKFKKAKLEGRDKKASDSAKKKIDKGSKKSEESVASKDSEGDKEEVKEKKAAVVESGKQMEKAAAKQAKHMTEGKSKQTRPIRKALGK